MIPVMSLFLIIVAGVVVGGIALVVLGAVIRFLFELFDW
jgi:hypothetical protein